MIVTPKSIPVRHNGRRYLVGEEFEISTKDYERIADHVEIIDESAPEKPIDDMKLDELKEYAFKYDIDLGGATKKEDILAIIKVAVEQNNGD